jgi:predicted site-specific integrase-resolvase
MSEQGRRNGGKVRGSGLSGSVQLRPQAAAFAAPWRASGKIEPVREELRRGKVETIGNERMASEDQKTGLKSRVDSVMGWGGHTSGEVSALRKQKLSVARPALLLRQAKEETQVEPGT